ncbi:MAG: PQQ-binding-like beta-propeller repeat protein [Planctomycetales bacterium]|nr:PQQ-binding-like beta-propeller repeat protein [Planctomycetales bacterium]
MLLKNRFLFGLSVILASQGYLAAEDWPTFRGVGRTAVSSETGLLSSWGSEGPELLWTGDGAGRGYASPAVSHGRIYTLGDNLSTANDDDEYLTCFDAETGKQVWKCKTGPAWNSGRDSWQGSRSTPTIDGDRVFVLTPFGKLVCASAVDGSLLWQKDLKADFGGDKKDGWGYSESPLVDGNRVVVTPGGPQATMVALDKANGGTIWTCQRTGDVGAGHSSVVISQVGGKKIYVQNTGGGAMGVDAATGELLWKHDCEKPPTAFIPTPIVQDDLVYSVAGYGNGGALLRQVPGANGSINVNVIYDYQTKLGNKHGGVVLVGEHLYFGNEDKNVIKCADFMTGDILWEERGAGSGSTSVAFADGKLFLRYQNGTVALASANPGSFQEISTFKTPNSGGSNQPSWAHPVIADGRLYLREGDAILCYDIRK